MDTHAACVLHSQARHRHTKAKQVTRVPHSAAWLRHCWHCGSLTAASQHSIPAHALPRTYQPPRPQSLRSKEARSLSENCKQLIYWFRHCVMGRGCCQDGNWIKALKGDVTPARTVEDTHDRRGVVRGAGDGGKCQRVLRAQPHTPLRRLGRRRGVPPGRHRRGRSGGGLVVLDGAVQDRHEAVACQRACGSAWPPSVCRFTDQTRNPFESARGLDHVLTGRGAGLQRAQGLY